MTDRKVHACGTRVILKLSNVEGIIHSVLIRYSLVIYQIKYFIGGEYRIGEFSKDEFYTDPEDKRTVGFVQQKGGN